MSGELGAVVLDFSRVALVVSSLAELTHTRLEALVAGRLSAARP